MNRPGEKFVAKSPEAADIDAAAAELLDGYSKEMTTTKRLKWITAAAAVHIPAVSHAGITLITHRGVIRSVAASDVDSLVIDNIAQRYLQGPCFEVPKQQRIWRVDDVNSETRWPVFTQEVLSQTSVRSMLSIQLFGHSNGGAVLNLYAEHPNAFDEQTEEISLTFAAHAALAIETDRRTRARREPLVDRDLIAQATGVLMGRFNIDASAAFVLLTQLSGKYRQVLPETANRVLNTNAT
ncbi:ANTAR domain protein [Mycobacterium kansasii 732]|nr:ANTAR domain protein [Mycobacterium kansasii 732]